MVPDIRASIARTVAALSAALILTGCAYLVGGSSAGQEQNLRDRAHLILDAWAQAVASATPDAIAVAGDLTGGGGWNGPNAGDQKIAFLSGVIDASPPLPTAAPPDGQVTWSDGRTRAVALLSAAEAFDRMKREASDTGNACPECQPLVVTGAQLVTGQIQTALGPAQAPLWQFEWVASDEPLQPITYVAIKNVTVVPPESTGPVQLIHVDRAYGSAAASDVTVQFVGSPGPGDQACGKDYTAEAVESDLAIVVIVHQESSYTGPPVACSLVGALRTAVAHLSAPLGNRVILDLQQGTPVPLSNEPPPPDQTR